MLEICFHLDLWPRNRLYEKTFRKFRIPQPILCRYLNPANRCWFSRSSDALPTKIGPTLSQVSPTTRRPPWGQIYHRHGPSGRISDSGWKNWWKMGVFERWGPVLLVNWEFEGSSGCERESRTAGCGGRGWAKCEDQGMLLEAWYKGDKWSKHPRDH